MVLLYEVELQSYGMMVMVRTGGWGADVRDIVHTVKDVQQRTSPSRYRLSANISAVRYCILHPPSFILHPTSSMAAPSMYPHKSMFSMVIVFLALHFTFFVRCFHLKDVASST
jgi:hypothetical protein